MKTLIAILAKFFGILIAHILPAIGKEVRKNNSVNQTGADHETTKMLDDDIWNSANSDRLQPKQNVHPESSVSSRCADFDNR